jgi:membrane-bound ClpP family serine protease
MFREVILTLKYFKEFKILALTTKVFSRFLAFKITKKKRKKKQSAAFYS